MTGHSGGRPSVRLRAAGPADTAFFRHLYGTTRADELALMHWDDATATAFLDHQFAAQTSHYTSHYRGATVDVVLVDNAPAGRLLVYRGADEIRIVDISLVPEARGRGAGSSLLAALMSEAESTGRLLTIHVEKHHRARGLYRRLGFVERADRGVHVFMSWEPHSPALVEHRLEPRQPVGQRLVRDQEQLEAAEDAVLHRVRPLSQVASGLAGEDQRERIPPRGTGLGGRAVDRHEDQIDAVRVDPETRPHVGLEPRSRQVHGATVRRPTAPHLPGGPVLASSTTGGSAMEQPTRRAVLTGGVLAVTALGLGGLRPSSAWAGAGTSTRLRRSTFSPYVGTVFELVAAAGTSRARLGAVADLPAAEPGQQYRFSLRFEMLDGARPAEGVFAVRHAGMRPVELFIAPAGGTPGQYEAVVYS